MTAMELRIQRELMTRMDTISQNVTGGLAVTTKYKFGVGEYTMRNGGKATVYEVAKDGTLIGARDINGDGSRVCCEWRDGGVISPFDGHDVDLMPPKRKAWINVAADGFVGRIHKTKEEAEQYSKYRDNFSYCIEIEIPE